MGSRLISDAVNNFKTGFEVHKHEFTKNAQKMADAAGNIVEVMQNEDMTLSQALSVENEAGTAAASKD